MRQFGCITITIAATNGDDSGPFASENVTHTVTDDDPLAGIYTEITEKL